MANDICATTYWYQDSTPPRDFFRMPPFPQLLPGSELRADECNLKLPNSGNWWLCGPFAEPDDNAFLNALPVEKGRIDPDEVFDGGYPENSLYLGERAVALGRNQARWVKADSLHGFIDFNHFFRCAARGVTITEPAVAIARGVLHAPQSCRAHITLSWDDRAALTVNGEIFDLGQHVHFRTRTIEVPLNRGANEIAVKLTNRYGTTNGAWAFAFRCMRDDGEELWPEASNISAQHE